MPGLTAWQGLFEHGRLRAGQSVLMVAPKLFISWGPKLLWVPSFGA